MKGRPQNQSESIQEIVPGYCRNYVVCKGRALWTERSADLIYGVLLAAMDTQPLLTHDIIERSNFAQIKLRTRKSSIPLPQIFFRNDFNLFLKREKELRIKRNNLSEPNALFTSYYWQVGAGPIQNPVY